MANSGNPAGTWEDLGIPEPRQHHHLCLLPGTDVEVDFTEDCCFSCNRWDPLSRKELAALEKRRKDYEDLNNGK